MSWQPNPLDRVSNPTDKRVPDEGSHIKGNDKSGDITETSNDSGFFSAESIPSNSSLSFCSSSDIRSINKSNDSLGAPPRPPDHNSEQNYSIPSQSFDSGLDLSEKFSSLQLQSSHSVNSAPLADKNIVGAIDETSDTGRTKFGLTLTHLSILKEIFTQDEEGDT